MQQKQNNDFLNNIKPIEIDEHYMVQIKNKLNDKIHKAHKISVFISFIKTFVLFGLLIGSLTLLFTLKKNIYLNNYTSKRQKYILPDSSIVILEKNSKIVYKISLFSGFNRNIYFEGIGYFEIKKSDKQKFNVHCNDLDITVLGTKFNVSQQKEKTTIALLEGKIRLYNFNKTDTSLLMHKNDIVEYNNTTGKITYKNLNPLVYTIWLNDKIEFKNYSLSDIGAIINQYYGKVVIFQDPTIKNKHIGGSAPTDDLSLILKAISLITNKQILIQRDTIIFK